MDDFHSRTLLERKMVGKPRRGMIDGLETLHSEIYFLVFYISKEEDSYGADYWKAYNGEVA